MRESTGEVFNLVAVDPGSNTGVAIYSLDPVTLSIVSVDTFTYALNNYVSEHIDIGLERNQLLGGMCSRVSELYRPNVLAMESAFLNSRFPKAVMQLSQYTSTVEQTFYRMNNFIKIYRYPPKYIKRYIGAGGNADKDDMTAAVMKIPELSDKLVFNGLTEHEIDAVAVGYITVTYLRRYPHLLISY